MENSFDNFYEDMGKRPSKEFTLDRIDVNGNYCKENCRWASKYTQMNNTSRNVYYDYHGGKYTLAQICKELDLPYKTIWARIHHSKMSLNDAISTSIGNFGSLVSRVDKEGAKNESRD